MLRGPPNFSKWSANRKSLGTTALYTIKYVFKNVANLKILLDITGLFEEAKFLLMTSTHQKWSKMTQKATCYTFVVLQEVSNTWKVSLDMIL
jgi:hypothetical protein